MATVPSQIDVAVPFDPTAYVSISGAQLLQYGSGIIPYTDKGLIAATTDIGGVPQVPDAATYTKWQNYIWLRIQASSVAAYIWNPNAASDPTLLKWQSLTQASIPDNSIAGSKLMSATITYDKIASCAWSTITGAPTTFPPNGNAGGDLTGTYPNPSVTNNAITTAKCLAAGIKLETIGDTSAGAAYNLLRVKSTGTGYEYVGNTAIGRIVQQLYTSLTTKVNSSGNIASISVAPNANATGVTDSGMSLAFIPASLTPYLGTSYVTVEVTVPVSIATGIGGSGDVFVGLYTGTGAVAPVACSGMYTNLASGSTIGGVITFTYRVNNPGAQTYYVRFGSKVGNSYINSYDGTNTLYGGTLASIRLTEYN